MDNYWDNYIQTKIIQLPNFLLTFCWFYAIEHKNECWQIEKSLPTLASGRLDLQRSIAEILHRDAFGHEKRRTEGVEATVGVVIVA